MSLNHACYVVTVMNVWMIMPLRVYESLMRDGVYRLTDPEDDDLKEFPHAYEWLNDEMAERVGQAPEGVVMPLRGWLRWEPERVRPDLRWMRWNWIPPGEYVLLQLEMPESQVLLMDVECWYFMLNDCLIDDSEEESACLEVAYNALPPEEQALMKKENWKRAFDVEYRENDYWRGKGYEVEALFWELRKEQVRSVKRFRSVGRKSKR